MCLLKQDSFDGLFNILSSTCAGTLTPFYHIFHAAVYNKNRNDIKRAWLIKMLIKISADKRLILQEKIHQIEF